MRHAVVVEKAEIDQIFGRLLSSVRKRSGFSQKQLGDAVGLSRVSIANIESGKHGVQLSFIFNVADILGVDVDELIPQIDGEVNSSVLQETKFLKAVGQILARS